MRQNAQNAQIAEALEADRKPSYSDREPTEASKSTRPDRTQAVTLSGHMPLTHAGTKLYCYVELRGPYLVWTVEGTAQEDSVFLVGCSVSEVESNVCVALEKGGELILHVSSATTSSEQDEASWYAALRKATRNDSRQSGGRGRAASPASAASMPIYTLADFTEMDLIGKGSGGEVWKATEASTGREVALKKLNEGMLNTQELQLLMEMDSPFVLRAEAYFSQGDQTYIVMPLLQGGDLALHLDMELEFNPARARFYAAEILLGLDYLHARNIIHRDLKPENTVLAEEGHIVLTDMGCARSLSEATRAHTFCGTAEYLAPEIMLNHGYSYSVDHWALGILLYEMLYGERPFEGDNVFQEIMRCALEFPPSSVPTDAQELIRALLQKDPAARPSSATIKDHPFFSPIDWGSLAARDQMPPYVPDVQQVKQWRKESQYE